MIISKIFLPFANLVIWGLNAQIKPRPVSHIHLACMNHGLMPFFSTPHSDSWIRWEYSFLSREVFCFSRSGKFEVGHSKPKITTQSLPFILFLLDIHYQAHLLPPDSPTGLSLASQNSPSNYASWLPQEGLLRIFRKVEARIWPSHYASYVFCFI